VRTLAREAAAGLAFAAIGVAVSLAVVCVQGADASPDPGLSYVWRGTNPSGQYCYPWSQFAGWHPCWHSDEGGGDYKAIDYSYPGVDGDPVWLEYTGGLQLFKMAEYADGCTGVRAKIYLGSYDEQNYKGDIHYLHIDPNEFWLGKEVPYQLIYIGDVLAQEDPNCYWDGAHLHQSADVSPGTPFYANKLADPTQDDEWEHAIMWEAGTADNDGDAWINKNELYIGTDPFDRCPDNTSDDAWPPDVNNNKSVDILDVLLFKLHMDCSVGEGCYDNRYDLNADGTVNILDVLLYKPILGQRCT